MPDESVEELRRWVDAHAHEGPNLNVSPAQFHEKEPAMFTRGDPGYTGRQYKALPSTGPGKVSASGVRLGILDQAGADAYAYRSHGGVEPTASKEFEALHSVITQVSQRTGQYYPEMAQHLMNIGERDINRHTRSAPGVITEGSGDRYEAKDDLYTEGPDGQQKLFGSHHIPAQSIVNTLYSTKEARVHAPALLAVAQRDTMEKYGRGLVASDNRSNFSEQLTKHVEALTGTKMTERRVSNGSEFARDQGVSVTRAEALDDDWDADHLEEIPQSEVQQGRNMIRGLVKSKRDARKKPPQAEQPSLF